MNVLEAKMIKKSFGGVKALVNGHICCPKGKIVGLLGANGSGKSTFSKIVTGLLTPDDGELLLNGNVVCFRSPLDAKSKGISMVHQHLSLIPDLTVWENISLGREFVTKKGFIDEALCREISKTVTDKLFPALNIEKKVSELLPSEQQLVEIAKALSQEPQLLILDEPTAALEQNQVNQLFGILRGLKQQGTSIIFISHRMKEVTELCDFVVVFRNGENVGTVDFELEGKDENKIISLITGSEPDVINETQQRNRTYGETMLAVKDLQYSDKLVDINFEAGKGEIVGVGGLQGQGQEELLTVLSGYIHADKGEIQVEGKSIKLRHTSDAIKSGIVFVPGDRQKEGLFLNHSVFMNIIYSKFGLKKAGFFIPFKQYRKETSGIVNLLAIKTDSMETTVRNLSGGNQQKIVVGKWLPHNPKVLLLSDPAKGVDVLAKKELYHIILQLADKGTTVILFASDNEELISYCDRVFVMYEGRIAEEIAGRAINEENLVAASLRTTR